VAEDPVFWWVVIAPGLFVTAIFFHQFTATQRDGRLVMYFWLLLALTLCVQVYRVWTK
jgi:hypothetical protein